MFHVWEWINYFCHHCSYLMDKWSFPNHPSQYLNQEHVYSHINEFVDYFLKFCTVNWKLLTILSRAEGRSAEFWSTQLKISVENVRLTILVEVMSIVNSPNFFGRPRQDAHFWCICSRQPKQSGITRLPGPFSCLVNCNANARKPRNRWLGWVRLPTIDYASSP